MHDEDLKFLIVDTGYLSQGQGQILHIQLPRTYQNGEKVEISVKYKVYKKSRALSWLTKEQTSTKKLPYLFSQCEDANCRAIAPLQDTPSIKFTYSASVYVEDPI